MILPPRRISTGPETPPEHLPVAENPQEQKERDKRQVETTAGQQLADISLDILEARAQLRPDQQETIRSIESLQLNESPEKQKEALKTLRVVVMGVLNKLFDAGMTLEQVKNIHQLPSTVNGKKIEWNDPTEAKAFQKVQDMLDSSSSSLGKFWKDLWPRIVEHDYQEYTQRVKPAADSIRNGTFEQTKGNGVVDWIKEHPFVSAGIAIAGAYGAYKLISGLFGNSKKSDDSGKKEEGGFFSKAWHWLLGGTAVVGGVFGVGQLLGSEKVQEFFKKTFNIDLTNSRIAQFMVALGHMDIWEAIRVLLEGPNPKFMMYQKVIDNIKTEQNAVMSHTCLRMFGKQTYKDFVEKSETKTEVDKATQEAITAAATTMGIPESIQKFLGIGDSKKEQQEALKKYLLAHQDKVTDKSKSVNRALAEIVGDKTALEEEDKNPSTAAAITAGGAAAEVGQKGTEKLGEVGGEMWNDLKEVIAKSPKMRELAQKYPGFIDIFKSPIQFSKDFINACLADGLTIIIHGGAVVLWDGYKFITVTTATTLFNTFKEIVESPFSSNASLRGALHTYMLGASPFIVWFGGKAAISLWREAGWMNKFGGFAKNMGKGFIYPIEVVRGHASVGLSALREGEYFMYRGKRFLATKEMIDAALEDEATYLCEEYLKYHELAQGKNMRRWWDIRRYSKYDLIYSDETIAKIAEKYQRRLALLFKDKLRRTESLLKGNDLAAEAREYLTEKGVNVDAIIDKVRMIDFHYKPSDVIEFQDGAKFKITEQDSSGKFRGTLTKPDGTSVKGTLESLGKDGKGVIKFKGNEYTGEIVPSFSSAATPESAGPIMEGYAFKNGDVVEFENGGRFKVSQVQEGALYGTYEQSTSTGTKTTFNQRLEFMDGKWAMYGEGRRCVAQDMKIKTTTAVVAEAAPETAAAEGIIEKVEYITKDGKQIARVKVKGNSDWIEVAADESSTRTQLIRRLKESLAKSGKLTLEELGKIEGMFQTSKLLQYFTVLEKIAGPATAAMILYHLNTAPDKKKALAETGIGLGIFMAGMKLTDWAVGSRLSPTSPLKIGARAVIDLMGGIAGAMGLTEPITDIVDNYILTFSGAYGASDEVLSAVNKVMTIYGLRTIEKAGIKIAEKTGIKVLEKIFITKVESTLLKRVSKIAGVGVLKTILKSLGWKGTAVGIMLADDAGPQAVIAWIDDILAVGLLLWSAKDIYDMFMVIRGALKLNEEMKVRGTLPISGFEIRDPKSQAALQQVLNQSGKTMGDLQHMSEADLMPILRSVPEMEVEITREGVPGKEVWIMKNGEVVGMKVKDASGEVIAEVKDKDAEKIDKALSEAEQKEKK